MRPLTLCFAIKTRAALLLPHPSQNCLLSKWIKTGTQPWVDKMLSDDQEDTQSCYDYVSFISLYIHKIGKFDFYFMLQKQVIVTFERNVKIWLCHKNRYTKNFSVFRYIFWVLINMQINSNWAPEEILAQAQFFTFNFETYTDILFVS